MSLSINFPRACIRRDSAIHQSILMRPLFKDQGCGAISLSSLGDRPITQGLFLCTLGQTEPGSAGGFFTPG